jgi:putative transcriptional regulator
MIPNMTRDDLDLTGRILMAMPSMADPRFQRAVVCMVRHDRQGALGLIVNKPRPNLRFSQVLKSLGLTPEGTLPDIRVHYGGPVEPGRGFVLHSPDYATGDATVRIGTQAAMTTTQDILVAIAGGQGPRAAVLALGYAGWGPGQLESEIAQSDWLVGDLRADLIFGRADEYKWGAALKASGIDPVSLSGTFGRA